MNRKLQALLLPLFVINPVAIADPFFSSRNSGMSANRQQKWFPLESNPELINDYIRKLGFDTSLYEFCDVFSTEEWALDMIPQPVAAVLLLYPLTETIVKHADEEESSKALALDAMQDQVWFIKQRIGNACGTIGLLHATMNAPEAIRIFDRDSWFSKFAEDCPIPLSPVVKAERLEGDDKIAKLHDEATSSEANSTRRGNVNDKIETHFVALVNIGNKLYELDGRREGPVLHGPTTQATLLKDSCTIIKKIMARDPSETRFAITALAPKLTQF
jgi:ubiquitin carboxyl-terminal hydrolase L3